MAKVPNHYDTDNIFSINNPIYAKVLEYPFDDAPKLIFADWLEEQDVDYPCPNCDKYKLSGCMKGFVSFKPRRCPVCVLHDTYGVIPSYFKVRADYIRESVKIANAIKAENEIKTPDAFYNLLIKSKWITPDYVALVESFKFALLTELEFANRLCFTRNPKNYAIYTDSSYLVGSIYDNTLLNKSHGFITCFNLDFGDFISKSQEIVKYFPITHWFIRNPFISLMTENRVGTETEVIIDREDFIDGATPTIVENWNGNAARSTACKTIRAKLNLFYSLLPIPNSFTKRANEVVAQSKFSESIYYADSDEFIRAVYIACYRYARYELFPEQRNQCPFYPYKNWY